MHLAIYARVSKEDQHPENQILELENYAKDRGYEIFKVYVDIISGAKDSRPALNNLIMDARNPLSNNVFSLVIVFVPDF